MGVKKMGRPTDCPKDKKITLRMDTDTLEKLQVVSQKLLKTRAEIIRQLIRKAYDDLPK